MATTISNIFTSAEAAHYLNIDQSLVCRYCRDGRLIGEKVGRDWIIRKSALDEFKRVPREPGNPTFKKP